MNEFGKQLSRGIGNAMVKRLLWSLSLDGDKRIDIGKCEGWTIVCRKEEDQYVFKFLHRNGIEFERHAKVIEPRVYVESTLREMGIAVKSSSGG